MFSPLPPEQCEIDASTRAAFEMQDAQIKAVLDPILFEHRDMKYAEYLECRFVSRTTFSAFFFMRP